MQQLATLASDISTDMPNNVSNVESWFLAWAYSITPWEHRAM